MLLTCATTSDLPSNKSTMGSLCRMVQMKWMSIVECPSFLVFNHPCALPKMVNNKNIHWIIILDLTYIFSNACLQTPNLRREWVLKNRLFDQIVHIHQPFTLDTMCPRSSNPFCVASYYIKWVTTSWTKIMSQIFVT